MTAALSGFQLPFRVPSRAQWSRSDPGEDKAGSGCPSQLGLL